MSLVILLSLFCALLGVVFVWLKVHYSYWAVRNVPHEKPVFFLGNMKGLGSKYHFRDINRRLYKRFKQSQRFVGYYTFLSRGAFIMDLDLIKQILIKDFGSFADRGLFHNVRDDPLTGNLLFLDGEQWRMLRQKLSPVFTSGKIKFMFPTMVQVAERLVDACQKTLSSTSAVGSGGAAAEIEMKDLSARFTTDVVGTVAFGIECNSLKDPNAEFRRMGRNVFEEPRHSFPVQAFMFANPDLARKLRMKNFRNDASEFFIKAVRETVELRQSKNIKRNDFMDMLIELKQQKTDDFGSGLTIEEIAAQAMAFFLAGFDTSSTTMSLCIYELALNQQIQEQLRTEIQQVLGKHNMMVSYECLKEMTYLDKIISETLRKYSVLPHLVRVVTSDYKLPNSDVVFERGLRIFIPIDAIQNDEEYFPNPEKFDPERFATEQIQQRHACAYLPFGDGPRNCIGNRFGKLQAQLGVMTLIRHFRFDITTSTQVPIKCSLKSFLYEPENGIHLKVEKL